MGLTWNFKAGFTARVALDVVMIVLLIWIIFFQFRRKNKPHDLEAHLTNPEKILSEIKEITMSFEKNLEEKRELSNRIIEQLGYTLEKADTKPGTAGKSR